MIASSFEEIFANGPVELIPVLSDFWHGGCVVVFSVFILIWLLVEIVKLHPPCQKQAGIPHW